MCPWVREPSPVAARWLAVWAADRRRFSTEPSDGGWAVARACARGLQSRFSFGAFPGFPGSRAVLGKSTEPLGQIFSGTEIHGTSRLNILWDKFVLLGGRVYPMTFVRFALGTGSGAKAMPTDSGCLAAEKMTMKCGCKGGKTLESGLWSQEARWPFGSCVLCVRMALVKTGAMMRGVGACGAGCGASDTGPTDQMESRWGSALGFGMRVFGEQSG